MTRRRKIRRRKKRRRRRADEEDSSDEEVIPLHYGETTYKCPCISDSEDSGSDSEEQCAASRKGETSVSKAPSTNKESKAWESTCLVRHGSLLEFGCFKFVFSITEHNLVTLGRNSVQYNKPSTTVSVAVNQTTLKPSESSGKQEFNVIESKHTEASKSKCKHTKASKSDCKHTEANKSDCKNTESPSIRHEEACTEQSAVKHTTEPPPSQLNSKKNHETNNNDNQHKSKRSASRNAASGNKKKKKSTKNRNRSNEINASDEGSSTDTCSENEKE
uniref:Uncharacterized protein n=1 Tax=Cacopsylla melanoneura TaxID=428564 RepID=A0A8D9FEE0_9HEMI